MGGILKLLEHIAAFSDHHIWGLLAVHGVRICDRLWHQTCSDFLLTSAPYLAAVAVIIFCLWLAAKRQSQSKS